jgi:argininosuccinate lyase
MSALALLPDLLADLQWNGSRMRSAIEPSMYATDVAIEAAVAGVPFRDAYRSAADSASEAGQGRTPESSLAARKSPGSGSDLHLDALRDRLEELN